jgi:hypothetical protein
VGMEIVNVALQQGVPVAVVSLLLGVFMWHLHKQLRADVEKRAAEDKRVLSDLANDMRRQLTRVEDKHEATRNEFMATCKALSDQIGMVERDAARRYVDRENHQIGLNRIEAMIARLYKPLRLD